MPGKPEALSGGGPMIRTPPQASRFHFISRRNSSKLWALILALLAQLIAGGIARGQATTSIRGTVTDSSGGDVSRAPGALTNPESKNGRFATIGDDGGFSILFLPPRTYQHS